MKKPSMPKNTDMAADMKMMKKMVAPKVKSLVAKNVKATKPVFKGK